MTTVRPLSLRRLKPITIARFFESKKWAINVVKCDGYDEWYCRWENSGPVVKLAVLISTSNTMRCGISIHDFRHPDYPNLHLNSYWYWPRNKLELREMYDRLLEMYSTVGRVDFGGRYRSNT